MQFLNDSKIGQALAEFDNSVKSEAAALGFPFDVFERELPESLENLRSRCRPSEYARRAFAPMTSRRKLKVLTEFASGAHTPATHWPLFAQVFIEFSKFGASVSRSSSVEAQHLTKAFDRLSPRQKQWTRVKLASALLDLPLLGFEVDLCKSLGETVGTLERIMNVYEVRDRATKVLLETISDLAGILPPWEFRLIVDFRDGASAAYSTENLPFSNDFRKDVFGCYFFDNRRKDPTIVLFAQSIATTAERLGFAVADVATIAFLHEFAHLCLCDNEDHPGSIIWDEMQAQWMVSRSLEDFPALRAAFRSMSATFPTFPNLADGPKLS